jgi:alpha-beta hydrolase superfamily lysophospholipase
MNPIGRELFVYVWEPDEGADTVRPSGRGVVQIVHGMAEHAGRYRHVAERLTAAGYAVYAADMRGHGRSGGRFPGDLGADGFRWLARDAKQVADEAVAEQGLGDDAKPVLIGHSMGAFVAQLATMLYPQQYAALVLSGAAYKKSPLIAAGYVLACAELMLRRAGERPSRLLHKLNFGPYNRAFRPNRTGFDWLSRDDEQVDRYIADPKCGYVMPAAFYKEFLRGLLDLYAPDLWAKLNRAMPILVMAGEHDPVGAAVGEIPKLAAAYRAYGAERLEVKLYAGMRHELFNELGREALLDDVVGWIERVLS